MGPTNSLISFGTGALPMATTDQTRDQVNKR